MQRPRVKPEHEPFPVSATTVRIGGGVHGIAADISDPGGWLWTLVGAADGSAGPGEIVRRVLRGYPGACPEDVRAALDALIDGGYMEDAAAPVPPELTAAERERYDRSMRYYRWADRSPRSSPWDPQRALKAARVVLIGLGGTGGTAALALAESGVGRLHCIDGDDVALSNLNRQILFTGADLGRPKAAAALDRLRAANSEIEVTAQQQVIGSPAALAAAVAGATLLVLCADEPPEIRLWANQACLAAGMPWVDSGYHGPLVTAGAYRPGDGACWECLRVAERDRLGLGPASAGALAAGLFRPPGHPATAVTAGMSGQLAAHLAVALLTGIPPVAPGTVYGVNLMLTGDPVLIHHSRQPGCAACGSQPQPLP